MPELRFAIRWPDGTRDLCYSPSTVIRDHFVSGTAYPLRTFLEKSRTGLGAASERVRQRYGAPCTLAMGQLAAIEAKSKRFSEQPDAHVIFESFQP